MGRITGLLLLLWAGATVSTVLDLQKRIIKGETCKEDERLYHVKLLNATNYFLCGGSLIHPSWILTAAHCYQPVLKAEVGVHPYGGTRLDITEAVPFKVKDAKGTEWKHDIMLLNLPNPVNNITPVPLPDCKDRPKLTEKVQIAGHTNGTIGPNKEKECRKWDKLQCADTDVASCAQYLDCLKKLYKNPYADPKDQHLICAKRDQVDICKGDSGGGVVYKGKIYGVQTASGVKACTIPVIIMDVCEYKDWIEETVPGLKFPK